jgi:hypothetical protein
MAYEDEKPADFIFSSIPRSNKQATSQFSENRVTSTVKSAIQSYLDKFLSPNGCFRNQLKLTAPYAIQYETGVTGSADDADPTVYNLQLARLWGELRKKLPCIIIIDKSFEYSLSGLGGISSSLVISSKVSSVTLKTDVVVEVLLQVAANDETTCSELRDLLVFIFGPLTIINKSHVLSSKRPQDNWEIRLPQNYTQNGLERKSLTDDPKDSFWVSGITLKVEFEGTNLLAFPQQTQLMETVMDFTDNLIPDGLRNPDGTTSPLYTSDAVTYDDITLPPSLNLGVVHPIVTRWLPVYARFVSDDQRVALVQGLTIVPKRLGKFNLNLMDFRSGSQVKILKTWPIVVKTM